MALDEIAAPGEGTRSRPVRSASGGVEIHPSGVPQTQRRNRRDAGRPDVERVDERRDDLLSVVDADRVDVVALERLRERRRGVAADEDEGLRREPPDLARRLEDACRTRARASPEMPDDARPRLPDPGASRLTTEPQVHDRRLVAPALRSARADVLETERLDAEERTESEALVAGVRPDEKNVHRRLELYSRWTCETGRRLREKPRACGRARSGSATGSRTASSTAGLHYGARWLPMPVLNGDQSRRQLARGHSPSPDAAGIRDNFRQSRSAPRSARRRASRGALFFEYGRHTIDTWRLRERRVRPADHDASTRDARVLRREPARGTRLPARDRATSATGRWAPSRSARHAPHAGGRRPAGARSPRVQEMRQHLRDAASASSRSTSGPRWRRRSRSGRPSMPGARSRCSSTALTPRTR